MYSWEHVLFKLQHSFPKLAVLSELYMIVFGAHVLYSVQVQLGACFCRLGSFERP